MTERKCIDHAICKPKFGRKLTRFLPALIRCVRLIEFGHVICMRSAQTSLEYISVLLGASFSAYCSRWGRFRFSGQANFGIQSDCVYDFIIVVFNIWVTLYFVCGQILATAFISDKMYRVFVKLYSIFRLENCISFKVEPVSYKALISKDHE